MVPLTRKDKLAFWDSMCSVGNSYIGPWLCIGDFNMILDQSEKTGGRPYACSSTDPFHNFINGFGLIDLGFSGNPFTWSNHRDGDNLIKERLDRGLASPNGFTSFPSYSIRHLPAHTSDHNPLLLSTMEILLIYLDLFVLRNSGLRTQLVKI
jgi:endonuclease/exonuclease/phosphatase family metal-dependent hydrolase